MCFSIVVQSAPIVFAIDQRLGARHDPPVPAYLLFSADAHPNAPQPVSLSFRAKRGISQNPFSEHPPRVPALYVCISEYVTFAQLREMSLNSVQSAPTVPRSSTR